MIQKRPSFLEWCRAVEIGSGGASLQPAGALRWPDARASNFPGGPAHSCLQATAMQLWHQGAMMIMSQPLEARAGAIGGQSPGLTAGPGPRSKSRRQHHCARATVPATGTPVRPAGALAE